MVISKEISTLLISHYQPFFPANISQADLPDCPVDILEEFKKYCKVVFDKNPSGSASSNPQIFRQWNNVLQRIIKNSSSPDFTTVNSLFRLTTTQTFVNNSLHFSFVSEVCLSFSTWYLCEIITGDYQDKLEAYLDKQSFLDSFFKLGTGTAQSIISSIKNSDFIGPDFYSNDRRPLESSNPQQEGMLNDVSLAFESFFGEMKQSSTSAYINQNIFQQFKTFLGLSNLSNELDWLDIQIINAYNNYFKAYNLSAEERIENLINNDLSSKKERYLSFLIIDFLNIIFKFKEQALLKIATCLYKSFFPNHLSHDLNILSTGEGKSGTVGIFDESSYGQHFFSYELYFRNEHELNLFSFWFNRAATNELYGDLTKTKNNRNKSIKDYCNNGTLLIHPKKFKNPVSEKLIIALKLDADAIRKVDRLDNRAREVLNPFRADRFINNLWTNIDLRNLQVKPEREYFIDNLEKAGTDQVSILVHFYLFGTDFLIDPNAPSTFVQNKSRIKITYKEKRNENSRAVEKDILTLTNTQSQFPNADGKFELQDELTIEDDQTIHYSDIFYDHLSYTLTIHNSKNNNGEWKYRNDDFKVTISSGGDHGNYDEISTYFSVLEGDPLKILSIDDKIQYKSDKFNLLENKEDHYLTYSDFLVSANAVSFLKDMCIRILRYGSAYKFDLLSTAGFVGKEKTQPKSNESKITADPDYSFIGNHDTISGSTKKFTKEKSSYSPDQSSDSKYAALRYSFSSIKLDSQGIEVTAESYTDNVASGLHNSASAVKTILDKYINTDYYIKRISSNNYPFHSYNPVLSGLRVFSILEAVCFSIIKTSNDPSLSLNDSEKGIIKNRVKNALIGKTVEIYGTANQLTYSDYITVSEKITTGTSDEFKIIQDFLRK